MPRVPKSKVAQDTGEVIRFRSMEEQLLDENKRLKRQVATALKENAYMRAQLKLPDEGPIWPKWIDRNTVRKTNDPDWPYQGLNNYGNQMLMHCTGKWEHLARVIYREHYGEIPPDHEIHHIDGDKLNNDPENLTAIPKSEFYSINNT